MMNYKESELQTIEELAALFFKPSEIAIVLEINAEEFIAEILNSISAMYLVSSGYSFPIFIVMFSMSLFTSFSVFIKFKFV